MSKQTNTDFRFMGSDDGDIVPVPRLSTSFEVDYLITSVATADILSVETGLTRDQTVLRITTTSDCFVTSAVTPTAVSDGTNHFLAAGIPQDIIFPSAHKLAFISDGTNGSARCTALI